MNKILLKFVRHLVGPDFVVIPAKPPRELLLSMAMRENHAWGAPGYFDSDEEILAARKSEDLSVRLMANQALTAQEKENSLVTFRQLHEEVVGRGFYKYEN